MELVLTGGTGQQRAWFDAALKAVRYPLDHLEDVTVTVSWPVEPSLPGHKEFACTTTPDGLEFTLEIRRALDTSTVSDFSGRLFYEETVVHELAHVICFALTTEAEREAMCPWFFRYVSGEGEVRGVAADLNPIDAAWGDRIQETMAEVIKDSILASGERDYDNRTNWKLDESHYQEFMQTFLPVIETGAEHIFSSSDLTAHLPPETPQLSESISWGGWLSQLPGGQTYVLRFRANRPDGGYSIFRDYGPIEVPDGMVLEPWSEPAFPDVGSGNTVAIHTRYLIWDNVDPDTAVWTTLETILTVDPEAIGFWRQWSFLEPSTPGVDPLPWPYHDAYLAAGQGDTMIFRTL